MDLRLSEDLQVALKSKSSSVRRDATATLAQIAVTSAADDSSEAQRLLRQLAHYDPDDRVRMIAGTALGWDPVFLEAIAIVFHSKSVPARLDAVATLEHFLASGSSEETSLAHEWLVRVAGHDQEARVREFANTLLPVEDRIGHAEPGHAIESTEYGRDVRVRRADRVPAKPVWGYVGIVLLIAVIGSICVVLSVQLRLTVLGWINYLQPMLVPQTTEHEQPAPTDCTPETVGKHVVAFSSEKHDILLLDVDQGIYTNLTSSTSLETEPVWSPDGSMLAFLSTTVGAERQSVEVLNLVSDIRNPRAISDDVYAYGQLTWSPDGTQIFFMGRAADSKSYQDFEIFTAQVNTDDVKRLTDTPDGDIIMSLSPDGKQIAYVHQDFPMEDSTWAHSDIELITSLGASLGDVSMNQAVMYPDIQWSPDSLYLYFVADGIGIDPVFNIPNPDIFRIQTDGSGITPITNTELLEQWFLLSPTGQDIAYAVGERDVVETGLRTNLSLMTSGGDKITQITFDHSPGSVSWSPGGEYLLYTAFLERDEDRSKDRYQLSLYVRANQQSKNIATGTLPLIFAWAPDGTEFLYRLHEANDDGCVLFLASAAQPSTPIELPCISAYDGPYRWRP